MRTFKANCYLCEKDLVKGTVRVRKRNGVGDKLNLCVKCDKILHGKKKKLIKRT